MASQPTFSTQMDATTRAAVLSALTATHSLSYSAHVLLAHERLRVLLRLPAHGEPSGFGAQDERTCSLAVQPLSHVQRVFRLDRHDSLTLSPELRQANNLAHSLACLIVILAIDVRVDERVDVLAEDRKSVV